VLPRGLLADVQRLLADAGSSLVIRDQRPTPAPTSFRLAATLTPQQQAAVDDLAGHEHGVLVAPPGTGKSVMACALLARHGQPTLVIVDRKPLLEQWRSRLQEHLGLAANQIGQLGGGRDRQTTVVDLAMAQSLARRGDLASRTAGYGLVVVDECHHVPAVTFEACVNQIPARRWIGLPATPYRRDGLQAIIAMHCGPTRHQIALSATSGAALPRELIIHETDHAPAGADEMSIQQVFRALVEDQRRTAAICADILDALDRGRRCLVLSQWTEHLEHLCEQLHAHGRDPLVLKGGMGKKARSAVLATLTAPDPTDGLLLLATGSYLGEGFDCPQLDTLFLAFPLAFKGRLIQYVGRILRAMDGKQSVEVHDYLDAGVPVLASMHTKRLSAFAALGFETPRARRRRV
jgi:superfamily II DNA or RNA helicase